MQISNWSTWHPKYIASETLGRFKSMIEVYDGPLVTGKQNNRII